MTGDRWGGETADRFVGSHYASASGQVRTALIDRHLEQHLPDGPLRILDVGAGGGTQSIPWARRGHTVTLLDSSPGMLKRAHERVAGEEPDVIDRVTIVPGDAERLSEVVQPGTFDLVMCHGVIMYFEDPVPLVSSLAAAVRPGGLVSVVAKNRAALAMRPGIDRNWSRALEAFDADGDTNRLGFETRADTVEDLQATFRQAALEPLTWYGVRLFTEMFDEDETVPPGRWDLLLEVEYEASRRDPYRQLSRLFHLVGMKRG